MIDRKLVREIKGVVPNLRLNEPMRLHTSFRVGGPAEIFAVVKEEVQLKRLMQILKENNLNYFLHGGGTNTLVRDGGIRGVIIKLGKGFKEIKRCSKGLVVGAAAPLARVLNVAQNQGLSGLEFASGIPGRIGGAIAVNASAFGASIKPLVTETKCLKDTRIILEAELELSREDSEVITYKAREYLRYKKGTQPLSLKSAGCIFKNPPGKFAGRLIEEAGLKGKRVGGAYISSKHANFIINRGNARASDILNLMEIICERIESLFGITLEPEINIVGETR